MKLLYLSCHAILEHDELSLFNEMGIDFFSMGSYLVPTEPVDKIRPLIKYDPFKWLKSPVPPREDMPKSFIDNFDVIMVMHIPEWIEKNWEKFKGKTVIWRTIGQSTPSLEARLKKYRNEGLRIVRYSPREERLKNYLGADALIRFYKDENEFKGWHGAGHEVMTIAQDMKRRAKFCNFDAFNEIVTGFNGRLYGRGNENAGDINGGYLTYEEMKQKLKDGRVYIYTGTQPASYTLGFIEAYMTGIPVISIGEKLWGTLNEELGINESLLEVTDLINNAVDGFYSDDIGQIREWITALVNDWKLAKRIGEMGRQNAIKHFGKNNVKLSWERFFNNL